MLYGYEKKRILLEILIRNPKSSMIYFEVTSYIGICVDFYFEEREHENMYNGILLRLILN